MRDFLVLLRLDVLGLLMSYMSESIIIVVYVSVGKGQVGSQLLSILSF